MDKHQSRLFFNDYKVHKISYLINDRFEPTGPIKLKFNIGVSVKISEETDKSTGEVILDGDIFENAEQNNYPFTLSITIKGQFSMETLELDKEEIERYYRLNAPTILFPFFRSAVADITKTANISPILVLPLINIHSLMEDKLEQ